ncbi:MULTISPECIES: chaplin [Streptomyces]|uniref:Chaplin n=1 Tax=Streptomyces morookaense TaxID=1970 RepID=A0A7Y7B9W0_STRMO|nr:MULTISPECIES: chaplin [Streptomyces]MCC2279151.1 chaplin [Streptomyces sp. ET3-23]NVK81236.1 chaplin [Streptomyces morookaense]
MKNMKKAAAVTIAAGGLALMGAGIASAHGQGHVGAGAESKDNPGVVSGNVLQVPVEVPVNVCGNTVNVVGLLNPAHGNLCVNE